MFRRKRQATTSLDAPDSIPDVYEQVATLRGRIAALELEWDDARAQLRRGYQRMEKANDRAEAKVPPDISVVPEDSPKASTFAEKYAAISR